MSISVAEQSENGLNQAGSEPVLVDFSYRVEQAIIEEVSSRLNLPKSNVEVEYMGLGNTRRCSAADVIDVTIPDREDFKGSIITSVTALVDDEICGKWSIRPKVAIWDMVPVATENISAGQDITYSYHRHRRDRLMTNPASSLEGTIATTHIDQGAVILENQVKKKPDKFNGDSVVLVYTGENLKIKANGRLMSDAYVGESVKVVSEATNAVIWGKLQQNGMVEIQRGRK